MEETFPKRRVTANVQAAESGPDAEVVVDYIGDMCRELAQMARRAGKERLAGLLEMACFEATGKASH